MKKWIADLEREIKHSVSRMPEDAKYVRERSLEIFEECLADERYMLMSNALQLISFVQFGKYRRAVDYFLTKIAEWRTEFIKPSYGDRLERFVYETVWNAIVSLGRRVPYFNLQVFDFE